MPCIPNFFGYVGHIFPPDIRVVRARAALCETSTASIQFHEYVRLASPRCKMWSWTILEVPDMNRWSSTTTLRGVTMKTPHLCIEHFAFTARCPAVLDPPDPSCTPALNVTNTKKANYRSFPIYDRGMITARVFFQKRYFTYAVFRPNQEKGDTVLMVHAARYQVGTLFVGIRFCSHPMSRAKKPHRTAPHHTTHTHTTPHHTALHRTAPHRTAPQGCPNQEPMGCRQMFCTVQCQFALVQLSPAPRLPLPRFLLEENLHQQFLFPPSVHETFPASSCQSPRISQLT